MPGVKKLFQESGNSSKPAYMFGRMYGGGADPDEAALQISNMVRDAIKPDVTMFLHYETLEENGKQIVAVDIQRGTERPYYIARKGLRPH